MTAVISLNDFSFVKSVIIIRTTSVEADATG